MREAIQEKKSKSSRVEEKEKFFFLNFQRYKVKLVSINLDLCRAAVRCIAPKDQKFQVIGVLSLV